MSVLTWLQEIGADFKNGLAKLLPIVAKGVAIAQAIEPEVSLVNPLVGSVFQTVVATISEVEQKFAALNQQNGTGTAKLAEAVTILTPVLSQALTAAGKAADLPTIQKYISAAVGVMNAIPAATAAPAAPAS